MLHPHIEVQILTIKGIVLPKKWISYTANEIALRKDGEFEPCKYTIKYIPARVAKAWKRNKYDSIPHY